MDGEVERQRGLTIEEQAQKKLVAQDIVHLHMVKNLGDMLKLLTSLFQGCIVKYDTGVLALCLNAILPENAFKTKNSVAKQTTPIHCLPDHHTIIAVLSSGEKMVEILLVYGVYRLTINTEKTKGKNQLNSGDTIVFLQRKPTE